MRTFCAGEMEDAIRSVQVGTGQNILKPICIVCKRFLSRWDIRSRQAVCWRCGKYFPNPTAE
jgi:hypothetical protein